MSAPWKPQFCLSVPDRIFSQGVHLAVATLVLVRCQDIAVALGLSSVS